MFPGTHHLQASYYVSPPAIQAQGFSCSRGSVSLRFGVPRTSTYRYPCVLLIGGISSRPLLHYEFLPLHMIKCQSYYIYSFRHDEGESSMKNTFLGRLRDFFLFFFFLVFFLCSFVLLFYFLFFEGAICYSNAQVPHPQYLRSLLSTNPGSLEKKIWFESHHNLSRFRFRKSGNPFTSRGSFYMKVPIPDFELYFLIYIFRQLQVSVKMSRASANLHVFFDARSVVV